MGARCTEGGVHLACGRPQSPQEGLWGPEEGPERRGRLHHARCRGRLAPRLHLARPPYLHSCPHTLAGAGLDGHSRDKRHRVKPNNLISCYTYLLYLPWRAYHGAGAALHGCLRAAAGGAQAVTTPLVHFYPYPSSYSYSRVVPPRLSLACSPPPPPWPPPRARGRRTGAHAGTPGKRRRNLGWWRVCYLRYRMVVAPWSARDLPLCVLGRRAVGRERPRGCPRSPRRACRALF